MATRCNESLVLEELRKGDRVRIEFPTTVDLSGRVVPAHVERGRIVRVRKTRILLETPCGELVELVVNKGVTIWPMNCLKTPANLPGEMEDETPSVGTVPSLPR